MVALQLLLFSLKPSSVRVGQVLWKIQLQILPDILLDHEIQAWVNDLKRIGTGGKKWCLGEGEGGGGKASVSMTMSGWFNKKQLRKY